MKKVAFLIACVVTITSLVELLLRRNLFDTVSYSNSRAVDLQLRQRDSTDQWTMLLIGDSEVRWGIDPKGIESAFAKAGITERVFNHAMDGFGAGQWAVLYQLISAQHSLGNVRRVGLGVQLIEEHRFQDRVSATSTCSGALRRPILDSAFGTDLGLDALCFDGNWEARLARAVSKPLWLTRYRPAVKELVWGRYFPSSRVIEINSSAIGDAYQGFEPHSPISATRQNFTEEFPRWRGQFDPQRDFRPLPPDAWPAMVASDGFFDRFANVIRRSGREPFFFALPTNPLVIDTFNRRSDYVRNSGLLSAWARSRGVVFVDLGIQDRDDADQYFSDVRHLSVAGAADYSFRLGVALRSAFDVETGELLRGGRDVEPAADKR